jgi:lipopolysaccharide export system protein LptA
VPFGSEAERDPDAPVEVTSQNLDVDQAAGTALFTGDVIVIQGPMRLNADQVLVFYSEASSQIERIEADGNVIMIAPPDMAEAQRAVYTLESGVVEMTEEAMLTRTGNVITGDLITIFLDAGTAQVEGNVRTIILPNNGEGE